MEARFAEPRQRGGTQKYDYKRIGGECLITFGSNYLTSKLFDSDGRFMTIIKKCLTKDKLETIRSFWAIGIDKGTVEWIISTVLNKSIDKVTQDLINEIYKDGTKK